ncbi:hypothetical protein N9481_00180 [Pelagibacteraceae bacterium]|nr:hypothetical protein [Pelagibacteraceae bacterium]|tara:strand:- start:331 stop:624 length:294 start_codon:yes stop_codon:yes gene_type:complete
MNLALSRIIFFLFIIFLFNQVAYSYSPSVQCKNQIIRLGSDLKIILAKINIMPPLVQIYSPLKKAFYDSIKAQKRKDYKTCISKTSIALKYSRGYAK